MELIGARVRESVIFAPFYAAIARRASVALSRFLVSSHGFDKSGEFH